MRSTREILTGVKWRSLIAESVAIVSSILLAFAIDAWWDGRGQAVLEQEYLRGLRTELRGSLVEVRSDLEFDEALFVGLRRIVNGELTNSDSIAEVLRNAVVDRKYAPPRAVLDDLISSGRLQLIHSADIREGLMLYAQMLDKNDINETQERQFVNERFLPHLSEILPARALAAEDLGLKRVPSANLAKLFTTQAVENLLVERLIRSELVLWSNRPTRPHLEHLIASIDSALASGGE